MPAPIKHASLQSRLLRIGAALFLILGGLMLLRSLLGLLRFGQIVEPFIATLGIAGATLGPWLWQRAQRCQPGGADPTVQSGNGSWLLPVGVVLILCVWGSQWMDLAPREARDQAPGAANKLPQSEIAEQEAAPALKLGPEDFPQQTKTGLTQQLRDAGHNVRCYGDLKPKDKLYPSITDICWTRAKSAWGIPLEALSFHFDGEALQYVRMEFPHDRWPAVRDWYSSVPGQDVGSFGDARQGDSVLGRRVAQGLMMTAPPSRGSTVLLLWESRDLLNEHCIKKEPWINDEQRSILCPT